jgi:Asp-tRNA(Asn)/Glu-tRNA(Gln) amidotransferase A subunit family amidase
MSRSQRGDTRTPLPIGSAIRHVKSSLPEFGLSTTTGNARFGLTLNPLALDRSPGGSSGGEAAAIAAGISAASDYGGSVRWPAPCTGIAALRPTPGRIPVTGQVPGAGGSIGDPYADGRKANKSTGRPSGSWTTA